MTTETTAETPNVPTSTAVTMDELKRILGEFAKVLYKDIDERIATPNELNSAISSETKATKKTKQTEETAEQKPDQTAIKLAQLEAELNRERVSKALSSELTKAKVKPLALDYLMVKYGDKLQYKDGSVVYKKSDYEQGQLTELLGEFVNSEVGSLFVEPLAVNGTNTTPQTTKNSGTTDSKETLESSISKVLQLFQ